MNRFIAVALIGLFLVATAGVPTALAAGSPSIALQSGSPHTITAGTPHTCDNKNKRVVKRSTIHLKVKIKGITFSRALKTKVPLKGKGHVQIYLDHLPAKAYKVVDKTHWIASIAQDAFPLCFPLVFLGRRGKHTLYFALGKTNSVLYNTKPAIFSFTAK
ncbi:MAG TPA: hypothetical protein VG815_00200 [Chloroflexota bacterium]|nr:hypothetical protein [Chloroflexota bacterium]